MLAAGVPMAIVSNMLRHSSIGITVDIYGHLSEDTARAASDAIGQLLDAAFEAALAEPSGTACAHMRSQTPIRGSGDDDAASPVEGETAGQKAVSLGTPPGTRTPNPLIKSQLLCQLS